MKAKNVLSNLFLVLAAGILICAIIFVRTGNKNDHRSYFLDLKFYQTTTGSMEPYMKIKSVVVVKKADISELAVGDVVCFVRADEAIAHRITAVTVAGLHTKGDNNPAEDAALVTQEEVIGKCVVVMNWVAVFLNNLETPTGILKMIVLPVLFLIVILLALKYFKMFKTSKAKEPEKKQKDG